MRAGRLRRELPALYLQPVLRSRYGQKIWLHRLYCPDFSPLPDPLPGNAGFAAPGAEAVLALERISPAAWLALCAGVVGCRPVGPWLADRADRVKGLPRGCLRAVSYAAAVALFAVCALAVSGGNFQPFIYNQF